MAKRPAKKPAGKPAKWIEKTHLFRADEYVCSACGYRARQPQNPCPGCGRPMKGAGYDPSWVDEMEEIDLFLE